MAQQRKTAPYQRGHRVGSYNNLPQIPWDMHMKAYEVYCHVYHPQRALIEGGCRGGFHISELFAFLYAAAFPKEQWKRRVDEVDTCIRDDGENNRGREEGC